MMTFPEFPVLQAYADAGRLNLFVKHDKDEMRLPPNGSTVTIRARQFQIFYDKRSRRAAGENQLGYVMWVQLEPIPEVPESTRASGKPGPSAPPRAETPAPALPPALALL